MRTDARRGDGLGRPPLMIVLPLIVVLLLAGVWSAVWYEGGRRAERMIEQWLAEEAARGRSYECAEREFGGFPFRAEVNCEGLVAEIADAAPTVRLEAARLRAVAVVWNLEHVIVEIDGPVRIASPARDDGTEEAAPVAIAAEWSLAQASLRAPDGRISRVDLAIEDLAAAPDTGGSEAAAPLSIAAERVEFHERHDGAGSNAEIALSAAGLVVTPPSGDATEPVDLALSGQLRGIPQPMPRRPADFLAAWRDNDGAVEITTLRIQQDDTVLAASGQLRPDADGRLEGTLTVTLADPGAEAPGMTGAFGGLASLIATALRLAGRPAELDGMEAVSGDLTLEEGRMFFGPIPLGELPDPF